MVDVGDSRPVLWVVVAPSGERTDERVEPVDRRRVDDGETPGQLGAVRARREREADLLHVALQRVVLIQPHLAADLDIGLAAHGDLLRLAQHH